MEKETQFTGVWVPEKIIRDDRLLPQEKIVGAYVHSMCLTTDGCYASNAHIAALFGVSTRWASKIVGKLIELGYCYLLGFTGKKRILRTRVELQLKAAWNHSSMQGGTTVPPDNKDYSKEDNSLENNNNGVGKEAKICLDYYFQKHLEIREYKPTVHGARDMKIFKGFLHNYDVGAVKEVIDTFFAWNKRSDFGTRALCNRFDTLYGVLKDKAEGKR